MVTDMFNEGDPELAKIFAQAREPLAADLFLASLLLKIERKRRLRMWLQIFTVAAVLGLAALNMPLILERTAAAARFAGNFSQGSTELLITPWGWAVSMLIGVWVLLRTRPSR